MVHGKATIIQKMWGGYEQKFPQCRALYAYMYTHPGKKLNFMGNEIAQFREWDEEKEPDNFLLEYPLHDSFKKYISDLNHLYLTEKSLHDGEYNSAMFHWLQADDPANVVYAYQRGDAGDRTVTVLNLSGRKHEDYELKIDGKELLPLINSDWERYSGKTPEDHDPVEITENSVKLDLPPMSAIIYRLVEQKVEP